ncbi:MAG: hypothetical protein VR69_17320 [Peptococcaceae bacterium BRH_c4b]|nr:MAG: hypothetical protein VR69_17320 [Peptococcaceae bacterium BRH_c4b]
MQNTDRLLTTAQVCAALGITPAKVRLLTDEGYLEIRGKQKYKHGDVHLFSPEQVYSLTSAMPGILSRWATRENARQGAQRSGRIRALEPVGARQVRESRDHFLSSLEPVPERTADLLRASYYLYHLNHYAKAGQQYLYDLKEKVLKSLAIHFREDPEMEILLVEGLQKIHLCQDCRHKARSMGLSYAEMARSGEGCPRCARNNSYYDLFEFNINWGEHCFSFHTPFSVGRKWFPRELRLPRRNRGYQQEQGLTFGRPITEKEARALPMDEVLEQLEIFLDKYSLQQK